MTTIGDSFAVVAILFGVGLTTWALILAFSLMFPGKVAEARNRCERRPFAGFGVGLLVMGTLGLISIVMASLPVPPIKLLGTVGLMALVLVAFVGMSGICQLMASRLRTMEPAMSPYAALARAAMLMAIAGLFPLVGWFLLGPALFITSLGLGVQALLARSEASQSA
jgi:hypothetical protein